MTSPDRHSTLPPPESCDLAVIGAGIVGLAVARELSGRHPNASVCVLERENDIAGHQTSHNSGVLHSGIYYTPGSLKARLCVEGSRELISYCEERRLPYERCGKLIVATDRSELAGLAELQRRGKANGVAGLHMLDTGGIQDIEPHARGEAALHSPNTGIVDFRAVAQAFAEDLHVQGGTVACGCQLDAVRVAPRALRLEHARGVTVARRAVFCGGAWADRLARSAGADADPRIVPFRGAYLRLLPARRSLVRALIYPVPDPSLPFLGVHLTRRVDGEVLIGPTALAAGGRDAYGLGTVRGRDILDTLAWPGTWRMLARHWRSAACELRHVTSPAAFLAAAARYVPDLERSDVEPAFAGVRAQAVSRDGRLLDDFAFSRTERALHVRNAPSPAASSSLAIARHVADEASRTFDLGK
ncbi:MAG: L-2-hydroxyglutarate oxidase [Solirubrobacteraceae bacterium]